MQMRTFTLLTLFTLCIYPSTNGEVHLIEAYDSAFVPEVVHVEVGDTVIWQYVSGFPHTVTSGVNCAWDGYFHEPLSTIDPVVEWVIPSDAPSDFYYYCAPHCVQGMTGALIITTSCDADVTNDGSVNVSDLLAVIEAWGTQKSNADITGDGIVDVSDLLEVVGSWGPCK